MNDAREHVLELLRRQRDLGYQLATARADFEAILHTMAGLEPFFMADYCARRAHPDFSTPDQSEITKSIVDLQEIAPPLSLAPNDGAQCLSGSVPLSPMIRPRSR